MNRKTLVLPAVVGLLAPVLAACGGTDSGSDGKAAIVVGTTDQFVATEDNPAPLDPAIGYEAGVWNVLRQTVQTLTHVPRGGGQPVPEAARSCTFTDRENESYRCKLRSGLTFADGTPVTAEDVKYSINRVIDIKSDSGPVGLLTNIDTIETSGADEVIFHLKTPDATFPYKLATPAAGIVQKSKYPARSPRSGFQVDGSGPYTMKPEVRNDQVVKVVFTRNPRYKGDLKVLNDKVELDLFPDAKAMGKALDAQKIDMMTRTMSPEQAQQMLEQPKDGIELTEMPGLAISYLAFDTTDPAVKSKAVRQAIAQVVDRGQIAGQVYGATAEPLYSLIPSSITGHTNSFYNKYGEPSTTKAAAILQAAGITDTGEVHPALHDRPLRARHRHRVQGAEEAAQRHRAVRRRRQGHPLGEVPPRPEARRLRRLRHGLVPRLPGPGQLHGAVPRQEQLPQLAVQIRTGPEHADPAVPPGGRPGRRPPRPSRSSRTSSPTDVPVLPIWQGKQYVASRDDLTGVEWSINSSADLQLWELGRSAV